MNIWTSRREHRVTDLSVGTDVRSHCSCRGGRDLEHRTYALSSFLSQLPLLLLVPFKVSGWEVISPVLFCFLFGSSCCREVRWPNTVMLESVFPTWQVVFLWCESQVCSPDVFVSWQQNTHLFMNCEHWACFLVLIYDELTNTIYHYPLGGCQFLLVFREATLHIRHQ